MISHDHLMRFARDEDDYPVMLYRAPIGQIVDWKTTFPSEVLYIPESLFHRIAADFIQRLGQNYYEQTQLNTAHIALLSDLEPQPQAFPSGHTETLTAVQKLLRQAKETQHSHRLIFEGP